jgi:HK97 family phage major capsid protein
LILPRSLSARIKHEEQYILTGTGVKQPLGLLDAGTVIPAGQIITTATTDVILPTELRGLPYRLTMNNRTRNSAWLMHRYTVGYIMTLRDNSGGAGTGQFLWQPSMVAGQPITIDGYPVLESEFMPNPGTAFTSLSAGEAFALFGDFSNYFIADFDQLVIEMSEEKYWLENCIAFKLYRDMDGALSRLSTIAKLNNG